MIFGRSPDVVDEYFVATLECELVCEQSSEAVEKKLHREFHPLAHGLLPGDGSDRRSAPWGAMTATLEAWGNLQCLETAARECRGLERVERSLLVSVTSGEWRLDHRVICPTIEEATMMEEEDLDPTAVFHGFLPILSPFDPDSGAVRSGQVPIAPEDRLPRPPVGAVMASHYGDSNHRRVDSFDYWADRAISLREVPDDVVEAADVQTYLLTQASVQSPEEYVALMHRQNGIAEPQRCSAVIRGRACYGDCLEYPEGLPMQQYMGTNKVRTENVGAIVLCGDPLAEFFAEHEMSESSKRVYCESFVAKSLVAGRAPAVTCSSYRIRPDCSSVF